LSLRALLIHSQPFVIPEQVAYTTRTITVPSTLSSVADINFNVSLTHSYLSDVEMEVISAQGTTVKLFDRSCSNTNSTLMLSYDDSGADLACAATSLQTVVPFKH
jgi:subtilisin-like proprotein convertase family protein